MKTCTFYCPNCGKIHIVRGKPKEIDTDELRCDVCAGVLNKLRLPTICVVWLRKGGVVGEGKG